ncbi:MAG: Rrf2 family transcriptional regulator [Rhodospirillaceae bacterium]|nr:Rrf2 family transcriptional regulator [Rhodospirillaceae bacterium]
MKDSSKARHAVGALVDLANQPSQEPSTLAAIAERQGISASYLEQLFARLRSGGLVSSVRGPGGGYVLARPPQEITIADIYCAFSVTNDAASVRPSAKSLSLRPQIEALWRAIEREARQISSKRYHP